MTAARCAHPSAGDFLERLDGVAGWQPDAPAVLDDRGALSYRGLVEAAAQQADELRRRGAGPGSLVGLVLPRGREFVVAVLACWRLGAAFVPVDPAQPPARRRAMLGEARAWPVLGDDEVARPDEPRCDPELAGGYVIYTSGSTGQPKGVRVGPAGLVPVLDAQIEAFRLGPGKRALWMLSPGFDASLSDIGTALLSGAALCPTPPGPLNVATLLALLSWRAVTHADLPPSLLGLLDPLPPSLRVIVIGGEVCPPAVVREVSRRVRLLSVYGPTEATICTSLVVGTPAWSEPRLGPPLPHVTYRVLDASGQPVDPGGEGELCIGGPALALGYLDRPRLEAERFVVRGGERLYRTGDRVRLVDGEPVFVGRVDRQVKLRGQLVAPEEIEAALRSHPAVLDAAVRVHTAPRPPRPPRELLVAHVVRNFHVEMGDLRAHLLERLPAALVPLLVPTRELPRTAAGKVDLAALAAAPLRRSLAPPAPAAAPSPFVALFADVLGLPAALLDERDDFFALGGDSHAALELLAEASARGLELPSDALYRSPTPAALAAARLPVSRTVDELLADLGAGPAGLTPGPSPAAWRGERPRPSSDRPFSPSAPPSPRRWRGGRGVRASRALLLTGATGFLGSRLLAELLAADSTPVHVLVRGRDEGEARERVRRSQAALGHAWADDRLRVWRGDASQARFGLSGGDWERLCGETGVLVHGAARLHLLAPLDELRAANVDGTAEALRWRRDSGGVLHHVSTLSVLVATDHPDALLDEDSDPRDARRVHGGYAQSKWQAEELVRRAGGGVIHRPGLLTGDRATGRPAPGCQLAQLLRGLAALGVVPAGDHDALRVDVTPVDHAARAMARLLLEHPEVPYVYHHASRRGVSLARLLVALRAAGVRCDPVSPDDFRRRWREAPRTDALATTWLSLGRLLGLPRPDADLFLLTGRELRSDRTEARTGLPPPPLDDALLERYVRAALAGAG